MAAGLAAEEPEGFKVWPDNMIVVDAFMVVSTQWRTVAMPTGQVIYQGLDYAAVKVGLDGADIALTAAQWSNLRMMERAAAAAMNGRS